MKKKLNYRKLIKNWMQSYNLSVELSNEMFSCICRRMRIAKTDELKKESSKDGTGME